MVPPEGTLRVSSPIAGGQVLSTEEIMRPITLIALIRPVKGGISHNLIKGFYGYDGTLPTSRGKRAKGAKRCTLKRCREINIRSAMNSLNNIDNILRRVHLNPQADFSDLPHRQKEVLNAISQMIRNGEVISEDTVKRRISKSTCIRTCFWSLWHKRVLIT
jgi:hypothetical protein